ncbi:MAG TPA: UDP-glucose/GDP-mannose dehydrogenase family protein [Candidatus Sulfotelmatobacter sp.]|jgi:UDPglucose 6-dehydrogenase|nr:UDP-glucose/GDP-mannose dehydrogenase family protein [Candidatus Sulfotelmatobacter sp.]
MTITFVGHGYVGLVSAAVFADLGNTVWVIGHTSEKVENLKKGIIPIYEPGLDELVKRNVKAKRLLFTLDYDPAISKSDVVFIAVGTPPKASGEADLSVVYEVAEKVGKHLDGYTVVNVKSTVPVGTNKKVQKLMEEVKSESAKFDIASVPEFLREGQAIADTMHPDRIVIGTEEKRAEDILVELHRPLMTSLKGETQEGGLFLCNIETAEMVKYASNAFLATKISFSNAIAQLSEVTGADGIKVLEAVGLDKRIGTAFLNPGAGYGGSCFPKDVKALLSIAKNYGYDFMLLRAVDAVNEDAIMGIVKKAKQFLGDKLADSTIGVLGLSFKPDTDDMRDAPSLVIINALLDEGVTIKTFDPVAMGNAKRLLKDRKGIHFVEDAYEAATDADLLLIITEWNEFRQLNLKKIKDVMKSPNLIDGRNIYSPEKAKEFGFHYVGVGRK